MATPSELLLKFYDIHGPITDDFLQRIGTQRSKHPNGDKVLSKCDAFDLDKTLQVDFTTFLASLQPMKPRLYSIANDPASSNTVDLVVALTYLDEENNMLGLCSQYLKEVKEGATLFCSSHPSQVFEFAVNRPDLPVLMVANGSGIAPFRYAIIAIWLSLVSGT